MGLTCRKLLMSQSFVGQAWVKLQGYDLHGGDIGSAKIESNGASNIEDCLAMCIQNPQCVGVTEVWTENPPECWFKSVSRWEGTLYQRECCHHYDLSRGPLGKEPGTRQTDLYVLIGLNQKTYRLYAHTLCMNLKNREYVGFTWYQYDGHLDKNK